MAINLEGIVTWLKGWFYEKSEVNTLLNAKVNQNQGTANYNVITDSSGNIDVEPKINVASGTGLSLDSSTKALSHSNSVTALTTASAKKIKHDAQGHITETSALYGSDIAVSSSDSTKLDTALGNKANSTHTHTISNITDFNTHTHYATDVYDYNSENYTNLGNLGEDALQSAINSAINTVIGNLQSIKAIEVVSTKPTASASTMGKLYIVSENSKVNVYYTERSGTSPNYTYTWKKMDADILDELVVNWSDVQNKPSTFTPSSHTHGNINNDGTIDLNHAVTDYRFAMPVSAELNLQSNKYEIKLGGFSVEAIADENAHSNIGSSANATQKAINTAIDTALGNKLSATKVTSWSSTTSDSNVPSEKLVKDSLDTKASASDVITSISLVPKSTDANGKIIFYTGDEPSP